MQLLYVIYAFSRIIKQSLQYEDFMNEKPNSHNRPSHDDNCKQSLTSLLLPVMLAYIHSNSIYADCYFSRKKTNIVNDYNLAL